MVKLFDHVPYHFACLNFWNFLGGRNEDSKEYDDYAEVWSPNGFYCKIPGVRKRKYFLYSQDGMLACGGTESFGNRNVPSKVCITFSNG